MEISTFAAIARAIGGLAPLAFIFGLGLVVWRTRSRHVLLWRIWQLINGKREIDDPAIRAFVTDESSLASFNMFSGVWVSSLDEARDLIRWTRQHNVAMPSLRQAGRYFDAQSRLIRVDKLPSRRLQWLKKALAMLSYSVVVLSIWAIFFAPFPLEITATQRTFLATSDSARTAASLWPLGPTSLRASDCSVSAQVNATLTTFSEAEVRILCDAFESKESLALVKSARRDWQKTLGSVAAFFAALLWCVVMSLLSAEAAAKLARRKLDPSLDDPQHALDWGDTQLSRQ